MNMNNCVCIGYYAGCDLPANAKNITIIGDNIRNLDKNQKNILFLGDNIAIGETIGGMPINLKSVLLKYLRNLDKELKWTSIQNEDS